MIKEKQGGFGVRPLNPVHRWFHRKWTRKRIPKAVRGMGFDWDTGFDIRNSVGPLPIKNQGDNDSCSGQSGSEFIQIQRIRQGITEGEISAKSIYSPIAYTGGGTTVTALIQQLCLNGANLEKDVPSYAVDSLPLTEEKITDKSWMNDVLTLNASGRAGYTPYDINEEIDETATVISQWGAVIFEIQGQNNGSWTSKIPSPPSKTNTNPLWAHFMTGIGAKMIDGKKYIVAMQSEGPAWGDQGIQYISEEYFDSGHVVDVFTVIHDSQLVPTVDNHSLWAELLRWFRLFKFQLKTT